MFAVWVERFKRFYSRNYKKLMIFPVLLFLFSISVLGGHKLKYGDFVDKDIDLKGGTIGTLVWNGTSNKLDIDALESGISRAVGAEVSVRGIYSYGRSELIALNFEAGPEVEPARLKDAVLSSVKGGGDYSSKTVGPAMGEAFLKMSVNALFFGLALLGLITFITFRTPLIVLTIVLCSILNALGALAMMVLFGIKLSPATVAGLLMILGYTDDTNVLITTSILKKTEGDPIARAYAAIKTGIMMVSTAFVALLVLWLVSNSSMLRDIALVLMAGLVFDIANTWFTNLGILLWHKEKKDGKTVA